MYTSDSLKAELRNKGYRLTPQREQVWQLFQHLSRGTHLSVEEVHHLLVQRGEKMSLSTVYRNIKVLAKMGILRELELAESYKQYELNTTFPNHHHHMVCIQCNQTMEFENSSVLKQAMKQVEKAGLDMIDCQLTIHTICPEALRSGWPARISSRWMCSRAIALMKTSLTSK
ncbi:transcriptional repressor [Scytonema sp. NUACC21]